MKNIKYLIFTLIILTFLSCEDNVLDNDVDPVNLNQTSPDLITNVTAMQNLAKGTYNHTTDVRFVNGSFWFWFVTGYHETMGDNLTMPWGNFGGRWVNQTASITLDDGTIVTPPAGGPQPGEIAVRNTRASGSDNATQYEWQDMYSLLGQCNAIIAQLDNIEGATQSQLDAFKAWALWWKAYAYHRVGSIYEQALIVNIFGEVDNNYVSHDEIIAESNSILNELETLLGTVSDTGEFDAIFDGNQIAVSNSHVDFDGLQENINTLRARNLVYNTKVADMTGVNWNDVLNWATNGVSSNASAFTMQSDGSVINDNWLPGVVPGFWYFPSPRLIQDINAGDNRLDEYFEPFVFPNPRGRGIQYGMTHFWKDVPVTPIVASGPGAATMYYAGSYEENQLLMAEAKMRTGNVEGGLANLDNVRTFQNSGLAATVGTGMTDVQALEEVRKERRLALIFRSVSFYDARRYGVAAGSRTGAYVLDAAGNLNTNATINYGYLEYWPVSAFEADFNSPGAQN